MTSFLDFFGGRFGLKSKLTLFLNRKILLLIIGWLYRTNRMNERFDFFKIKGLSFKSSFFFVDFIVKSRSISFKYRFCKSILSKIKINSFQIRDRCFSKIEKYCSL
uniref:Uncharacterized protein n=1 Tax=Corethron hystrix TaxID=216773 RepID=A0A6U5L352_9STRA|mmetsp:Transcript_42594/g.99896  ORF Transcript_42594/g.99896 Transcript_42594/m.99896 type:complete len:106 (+) Transcript_42594:843-1160(+)